MVVTWLTHLSVAVMGNILICCAGQGATNEADTQEAYEHHAAQSKDRAVGFKNTVLAINCEEDGEQPVTKESLEEIVNGGTPQNKAAGKKERQATGYIDKNKLKQMLDDCDSEEDDADDEQEDKPKPAAPKDKGKVKSRKGTGYVTKAMLAQAITDEDEEEEESDPKGKRVSIEAVAKVIDNDNSAGSGKVGDKSAKSRKGTGYVTKDMMKKILEADDEADEEEDDEEYPSVATRSPTPKVVGSKPEKKKKGVQFN